MIVVSLLLLVLLPLVSPFFPLLLVPRVFLHFFLILFFVPHFHGLTFHFLNRRSPAFTLSGRTREKRTSTAPGPNNYNAFATTRISTAKTAPAFSMGGRINDTLRSEGPGPASISSPKIELSSTVRMPPAFSMGGRIKGSRTSGTPGPGTYQSVDVTRISVAKSAPSFSMGIRVKEHMSSISPGPGAYTVPMTASAKTASLKGRPKSKLTTESPGPVYNVDLSPVTRKAPGYSMGARISTRDIKQTPGPGAYNSLDARDPKAASIKGRAKAPNPPASPGPGAYNATITPGSKSMPAYSMGGRLRAREGSEGPGPGAYNALTDTKRSAPQFSISGRLKESRHDQTPGPNNYNTNLSDSLRGGYSFGVRHSRKTGVLPD
eukprot:m.151124 g.151124  ORF g.151124 m.151124 type:complete len:377 (-) comp16192_c0_seq2:383-1513(-)